VALAEDSATKNRPRVLSADAAALIDMNCRRQPMSGSALGFSRWPQTPEQRCRVHKTANVLKRPKSQQSKAKCALQEIWMVETKRDALGIRHLRRQGGA
jgi:hypothetical protein